VTIQLPDRLLRDAAEVASGQDVTIGHLVRQLLAKEVDRRLNPKTSNRADEGLVAALQALLARDMAEAQSWSDLAERLRRHGYELRRAGGGLVLYKSSCGTRACKASELGFPYRTLMTRFGGPLPEHPNHGKQYDQAVPRPLNTTVQGRLKHSLEPVFGSSPSWETLITRLRRRGFVLRPMGTGTAIYTYPDDRHVCNTATIGYRYRALVRKFNAPMPGHPHGAKWVSEIIEQDAPEFDFPEFEVIERDWPPVPAQQAISGNRHLVSSMSRECEAWQGVGDSSLRPGALISSISLRRCPEHVKHGKVLAMHVSGRRLSP